jgi:dihydrofolate reductase
VITSDENYRAAGAVVVHSIDAALHAAGDAPEVMIIGGASFYEQMLPRADRIYLTVVHHTFQGDAWFPALDPRAWRETQRVDHAADEKNPYACTFLILDRAPPAR